MNAPAVGDLLPDLFFEFVDEVLISAGRERLDQKVREIVEVRPTDRVLQILAGPGSGKTEMLVWRVLYELFVLGTSARRVMVTTFTRKAATELEVRLVERSDALLEAAHARGHTAVRDPRVHDLRVGTIHSLCDALLAEFDPQYMDAGTQLLDEMEAAVRMLRVYRYKLGYNNPGGAPRTVNRLINADELASLFRAPWDDGGIWPGNNMQRVHYITALLGQHTETWIPRCATLGTPNGVEKLHHITGLTQDLQTLRERWSAYLNDQQLIDFATLQLLFSERQHNILPGLDHVLVDEFQDTNPIQFAIHTRWLDAAKLKLTVVGDDDQSMYRFRGSDIQCFNDLEPHCRARQIHYRLGKLEKNWRSTKTIVDFSQAFKNASILKRISMPKLVVAGNRAARGSALRLLKGPWERVCEVVASELRQAGELAGRADPSTALLFFSTSEKGSQRRGPSAPSRLREAIEGGTPFRVYNARNKTAARRGPVAEMLGLLSYLIDPVDKKPIGAGGRLVQVYASHFERGHAARSEPPPFGINEAHIGFQTRFMKADHGDIGAPAGDRAELVSYVDDIRDALADAYRRKKAPRLTLTGLVARLLSLPRYRNCGYTGELFRQALFTEVLESHVAPSRRTRSSLDAPLRVEKKKGKYVWPAEYWNFISGFGAMLSEMDLDDPDVEAFEDGAVQMMTFHQAKGLEFDHVYIGGTGRHIAPHTVLQTMVFSGNTPRYSVRAGQPASKDEKVVDLATADRDRELYVAITRPRKTLTFLWDPKDKGPLMTLHPVLDELFSGVRGKPHKTVRDVEIVEYRP